MSPLQGAVWTEYRGRKDTEGPILLIENPKPKVDRLTALLAALAPRAASCASDDPEATILVIGREEPTMLRLRLAPRAAAMAAPPDRVLAAVRVAFASPVERVFGSLAEHVDIALSERPPLAALAGILAAETAGARCGAEMARSLVASALLVMALRVVIDAQPPDRGLLAGLAEPRLHRAIVAIHEAPDAGWSMEALAERAGTSRSRFIEVFGRVMGTTPGAYLLDWRLRRADAALRAGRPVKEAAALAGFGSTAAFSRAFRRANGVPPSEIAR
jgi:AraC-like DNA-binding protein